MTKPLVTRILLSLLAYKAKSAMGSGTANIMLEQLKNIFPDLLQGNIDDLENAKDTSGQLDKVFEDTNLCFRKSIPTKLESIFGPGGISFQGLEYMEQAVKDLSEGKEADQLAIALRKDLSSTFASVLTPMEIDQCVNTYLHCLEDAIAKNFPSQKVFVNLFYKIFNQIEKASNQSEDTNENIKKLLDVFRREKNDINQTFADQTRLQTLPLKWYKRLIGRDLEVEEIYQSIIIGDPNLIVLYGPSGVGLPSIAREVVENVKKTNENAFFFWHKILPNTHDSKQALDDLQYKLSQALGVNLPSVVHQPHSLQTGFNIIIIEGLRLEVAPAIMEYLSNILYPNIRVIVTTQEQLPWENYRCNPLKRRIDGIKKEYIQELFSLYGYTHSLNPNQIYQLYSHTEGNVQRLINCAINLGEGLSFDETIQRNDETEEEVFSQLSEPSQYLLKIISLYDDYAHVNALSTIMDKKYPGQASRAIDELKRRLVINKDPNGPRYQISADYRPYMFPLMKKIGEHDEIRDAWTDFYFNLRKDRRPDFNDEIGWTIFTDYQPEKEAVINYSDEAINILSVINYCLGENRIATHWTKAAKLLDDFRATIFASGRWENRLEYCLKVVENAEREGNLALLGKFKRLLAWISCFRDEYEQAKKTANEAIQIASQGLKNKDLTDQDKYTHYQTLYKAHNTLGQIALREARYTRQLAQHMRNNALVKNNGLLDSETKQEIESLISSSVKHFWEAEIKFAQALLLLEEFPPESLIMEYHLAEVKYYDRSPLSIENPEVAAVYTYEQLNRVLPMFFDVLLKVQQKDPKFYANRPHQRLIANTFLYIGKIKRRLGELASQINITNNSEYFSESMRYLEAAFTIASKQKDRVLMAKIMFAQCQWHESMSKQILPISEQERHWAMAHELALEAIQGFQRTHTRLEREDAQIFLSRINRSKPS